MINKREWRWFGTAGHFICGPWCRFHLCTQVGPWLVSTVGQLWPERSSREIQAEIHDPKWLEENGHLKGDAFDAAYMKRFGFNEVGCHRKFETMVFRAGTPCTVPECNCGMPEIDGKELDMEAYNEAGAATDGHMAMCEKWAEEAA